MFRGLEQLSSSICCRVMSQQNMADMQEIEIFTSAFAGKFGTSLKNRK